jgi:hypothetical protein
VETKRPREVEQPGLYGLPPARSSGKLVGSAACQGSAPRGTMETGTSNVLSNSDLVSRVSDRRHVSLVRSLRHRHFGREGTPSLWPSPRRPGVEPRSEWPRVAGLYCINCINAVRRRCREHPLPVNQLPRHAAPKSGNPSECRLVCEHERKHCWRPALVWRRRVDNNVKPRTQA